METRANYVLIGAFTLAGLFGALGLLLWLAKIEIDRQFAYFDVRFESVSGLGQAGDVRFNGLPVGRVTGLALDPDDPGRVRVTLEVAADLPIRTDTVATLEAQGVTGVSYVALSGGTPSAPLLRDTVAPGVRPVITSQPSAIQSLFEAGPELLNRAVLLLEDLSQVAGPENRAAVSTILTNLASATARLDETLTEVSGLSAELSVAAREAAGFANRLEPLAESADQTLAAVRGALEGADAALASVTRTSDGIEALVSAEGAALAAEARAAVAAARVLLEGPAPELAAQAAATLATLDARVQTLATQAETTLAGLDTRSESLTAEGLALMSVTRSRVEATQEVLDRTDAVLSQAERTLASVEATSDQIGALAAGDGAALLAEARAIMADAAEAVAAVNTAASQDLPLLLSDIRSAAAGVARQVEAMGADMGGLSGHIDELVTGAQAALAAATDTFTRANTAIEAVSTTMTNADTTLTTATRTFDGVNQLLDENLDTIVDDLRAAVSALSGAVTSASGEIEAIAAEVRGAAASANSLMGGLDGLVSENRPQINEFMRVGLPEFLRFSEEARRLIVNMERLVDRVERDPARFLLGTQGSDFRR